MRCCAPRCDATRRGAARCDAVRRGAARRGAVRRVRCGALRWCARWRAGAVVRASGPHWLHGLGLAARAAVLLGDENPVLMNNL